MLILTSNGLSSPRLLAETQKYTACARTAAIVTTASMDYKEKDRHIPRLTEELTQLGVRPEFIDIETTNPEALLLYDVIEINGGNPFYLLKQIRERKAETVLEAIAARKILIGISAGSVVLQNNIDLIAQYSPEMNEGIHLRDLTALGLTDLEILPHYHRFLTRFERFEERAQAYERAHHRSVIRLDDGQGVFITEAGHYVL